MSPRIVLASSSPIRANLLRAAMVCFDSIPARVDEATLRTGFNAEAIPPRDQADALAEAKARKVGQRYPDALVIGCDQVLEHKGEILTKPDNLTAARAQLQRLRGDTHRLLSAAVIYENGRPVWRHVGIARMTMRDFGDSYLETYLGRNAASILETVGTYKLEEEGARLFSHIDGDYFTILGLPLLELLSYLSVRGVIDA